MPNSFQYDVIKLIDSVKNRPCIWDRDLKIYRNRHLRKVAWEEVFNILEPQYEGMSKNEKKITDELIMTKWTNVRDAFIKSLRNKPSRQYMYHNQLQFLVKFEINRTPRDDAVCSNTEFADDSVILNTLPTEFERDKGVIEHPNEQSSVSLKACKRAIKRKLSDDSHCNYLEIEEGTPKAMTQDEAFFASLLPSVEKYTDDQRLQFRIKVLCLMKRIKVSNSSMNTYNRNLSKNNQHN